MSKSNIATLLSRERMPSTQVHPALAPESVPSIPAHEIGPDGKQLTGAALAVARRKANAAAKAGQPLPGQQARQFAPRLMVQERETGFYLSLAIPDDSECPPGQEAALQWSIESSLWQGQLIGHDSVRISLIDANADELANAASLIARLDSVLRAAKADSDDDSLAHTVQTLATHYKVTHIVMVSVDGSETEIRRGESYIKAHKMVDDFLARHAKD